MSDAPIAQALVADAQEVGYKVFVGNLSFATKDEQLTEIFGAVGPITNAQIINRGTRSLGYGFVTFTDEADASKAISTLDKTEIAGRQINVELAKPPTATPAGRAPREAAQAAVASAEEGGEVAPKARKPRAKRPKGPRKPRADGETEEAGDAPAVADVTAQLAATTLDGTAPAPRGTGGRRGGRVAADGTPAAPRAPRAPHGPPTGEPSKTLLFVSNLAFSVTDETLAQFFGDFKLKSARVVVKKFGPGEGRSKGFGFVEVENEADQQAALQLSGSELDGRQITLKIAINPAEPAAEPVVEA